MAHAGVLGHSVCRSLFYLPTNTLAPAPCACVPLKTNVDGLAKLFFLKIVYIIFGSPNLAWGRVLFLEKVKALIKASWKYFMIETQAEKGFQKLEA